MALQHWLACGFGVLGSLSDPGSSSPGRTCRQWLPGLLRDIHSRCYINASGMRKFFLRVSAAACSWGRDPLFQDKWPQTYLILLDTGWERAGGSRSHSQNQTGFRFQ